MGYNRLVKNLLLFLFILPFMAYSAEGKKTDLYKLVFKDYATTKIHKIDDPISEFKTNTKLLEVMNKKGKSVGYIREVTTSTGCNDGCLPVIFTLFYDRKGKFSRLISRVGLTKKNHEEFGDMDYYTLETILNKNYPIFKQVKHPKQMVDAVTSATLITYKRFVIQKAAYTTLRTHLYNQHTLKFIKKTFKN